MRARLLFFCLLIAGFGLGVPARAVTVFSPVVEMEVAPGDNTRGLLKVYNETTEPITLQARVERLERSDVVSGQPVPGVGTADFLSWFTIDQPLIALEPQQVGLIPFTVSAPVSAVPGGYYAVIYWQPVQAAGAGNVRVQGRVGTTVLLTVSGEIQLSAEVTEFRLESTGSVVTELPATFVVGIQNTGTGHIQPKGTVTLESWFGTKERLPLNPSGGFVLPGGSRVLQVPWGEPVQAGWIGFWDAVRQEAVHLAVGPYTAKLALEVGTSTPTVVTEELRVWVLPWRLGSVGGLVLVGCWLLWKVNRNVRNFSKRNATRP